jgi:MFS family permease
MMKRKRLILMSLLLAAFVINLDTTIVNIALPSLVRQLHASNSQPPRVTGASSRVGVGPMTATNTAERHYTTGLTRENIERALTEAGKNPPSTLTGGPRAV